jgi:hypothetical protein
MKRTSTGEGENPCPEKEVGEAPSRRKVDHGVLVGP